MSEPNENLNSSEIENKVENDKDLVIKTQLKAGGQWDDTLKEYVTDVYQSPILDQGTPRVP